jgi:autotransporter translocation and assembly factor TamB
VADDQQDQAAAAEREPSEPHRGDRRGGRVRRAWRRLLRIVLVAFTLALATLALAVMATQTPWFKDWLRRYIARQAASVLEGELSIGRLRGTLFSGVELEGVTLVQAGERVIAIERVKVDYSVLDIISRGIVLDELVLQHPVIVAKQTAAGWNVARLVKPRTTKPGGRGPSVTISRIRVTDGQVTVYRQLAAGAGRVETRAATAPSPGAMPTRIDDLDASLSLAVAPGVLSVDVAHVSLHMAQPDLRLGRFSGRVSRRNGTLTFEQVLIELPASNVRVNGTIAGFGTSNVADLSIASRGLAFREVGLFLPAVRAIDLRPAFTAHARGPLDRLDTQLQLTSSAGNADGRVLVDFSGGQRRFVGAMDLARVNPAPWAVAPAFAGSVTGRTQFDLRLGDAARARPFTGRVHFTGPEAHVAGYEARDIDVNARLTGAQVTIEQGRARAYGAHVTVAGVIEPVPGPAPGAQYQLRGRTSGLDLRRVPAWLPIPELDTQIEASYDVHGRGRTFSGRAVLAPSIVEGAKVGDGTVGHFDMDGRTLRYGGSGYLAGLDLMRLGEALEIKAMTDPRFAGAITGTFTVEASGRTVKDLDLSASGSLTSTTLLGAEFPDLTFKVAIVDAQLAADVKGTFKSLEPEFVIGSPALQGVLNGRVDGRATIADLSSDIALDLIGFDGTIDLEQSILRGVEVTTAHLDGSFVGRAGKLDAATIVGPMGEIKASGPLDLTPAGASNLSFTVAGGDLARIGSFVGQPIEGTATAQGLLAGNGARFVTTGAAHVEQAVIAGQVKAESADIKYNLAIPDLDAARLSVEADVAARAVDVAGQRIATLDGHVGYGQRVVSFDARGVDGTRVLEAAGRAELQEGRQHVVLSKLAATVEGLTWRLKPGTEAAIDHDGRVVQIDELSLENGAQHVDVDGMVAIAATAASNLEVRVEGVQLAEVNRLLRRPAAQYAGVLTGVVTVQGSRVQPEVTGRFEVTQGSVRELRFEALSGDVHFDGRFLGTDVTLVQQAGTTLNAKGLLPLSLFQDGQVSKGRDPIDLRVTSSTIGLQVVSGLTTALTNLEGTAKVDLHVTGTADNPVFEGGVDLANAAFTLAPVGEHYHGLTSKLRFEPGRLVIDSLRVLDANKDPLEVTGDLGLRRTALGAVSLRAKARQFAVLRNEYGNIDVDADLRVTGEITRPRVEGEITFHGGRVEVDHVLDRLTGGAYDTEPLDDVPIPGEGLRADQPPTVGTITTASGQTRTVRVPSGQTAAGAGQAGASPGEGGLVAAGAKGLLTGATADVRVRIPDNLVLRGRDLRTSTSSLGLGNINMTVGGDFRIRKDAGTPVALVGTVNTVRGTYDFRGRRFDILRDGRIQFQGTQPIDPALDVTAQRVIQPSGIEARIRIQGTARNPTLSFSSTPPLDEADILALIVFNRPMNSLASGERSAIIDLASATAAGFVVSPLTESLGRALNLDLLEVETTSDGGNTGGMLTIGQQVGDKLYFKFRQQFGAQEVSEFVLEYQLGAFLRLQASAADGEGVGRANRSLTRRIERAGLDLIFYFSY